MAAKIKKPAGHSYNPLKTKPRGIGARAFEKIYWPYLPLLLIGLVAASIAFQPSAWKHLAPSKGKVLSYATEVSRDSLLDDTNVLRAKDNLADLRLNGRLDRAAQAKAEDMARRNYWSHNTPDGKAPWIFVTASHYHYQKLGENLAAGFSDSQSVINAWYASASHRQNILDSGYTDVGFGFANVRNYTAAGGGPMTLVVAMYGQPPTSHAAAPTDSDNPPATTDSEFSDQELASRTTRANLALAKSPLAPFATSIAAVGLIGGLGFWLGRHFIKLRRAWLRSERFVIKHPAIDIFLLAVVVLSFILSQTAGFIK